MNVIRINDHKSAMEGVFSLIRASLQSDDKRDITVILDRNDVMEFKSSEDIKSYVDVYCKEPVWRFGYFFVTSSNASSELFIENVKAENGVIKDHEGDILILPHYVPQDIEQACIDGSAVVIKLALESIHEKLVKIIEQ